MQDLVASDLNSPAYGINNRSEVVGYYSSYGVALAGHAFIYKNGLIQDLGTLGGYFSTA